MLKKYLFGVKQHLLKQFPMLNAVRAKKSGRSKAFIPLERIDLIGPVKNEERRTESVHDVKNLNSKDKPKDRAGRIRDLGKAGAALPCAISL